MSVTITKNDESSVLQLPNELIMEIFQYIPNRWKLTLVCRKFYEIVCKLEMNQYHLCINKEETLSDEETFNSIIDTERCFDSMKLSITINMTQVFWSRLKSIVSSTRIVNLSIASNDPRKKTQESLEDVFMTLEPNIVTELKLANINLNYIKNFIIRQKSIKILSVTGKVGSEELLEHLDLIKLTLINPGSKKLTRLTRGQKNLTELKLVVDDETTYDDIVFVEILQLKLLESLEIPLDSRVSPDVVKDLSSLKNLQKLYVKCCQLSFQQLMLTSITTLFELSVELDKPIANEDFHLLSQSMKNLTTLKVKGPLVVNLMDIVPIHFENLKNLSIENIKSGFVKVYRLTGFKDENFGMKHFSFVNHDTKVVVCSNDLIKFLRMFPNLETVEVSGAVDISLSNFENILESLPNLKEIAFNSNGFDLLKKVIEIVDEHGKNIKFIKLYNLKIQSDRENLEEVATSHFPVVKLSDKCLTLKNYGKFYLDKK